MEIEEITLTVEIESILILGTVNTVSLVEYRDFDWVIGMLLLHPAKFGERLPTCFLCIFWILVKRLLSDCLLNSYLISLQENL